MTAIACPACGSTEVTSRQVPGAVEMPYGPTATFTETIHACGVCGFEADFTGGNEAVVKDAMAKSAAASAAMILDGLSREGITQAHLERALRLPMRTTNRWKAGETSAAALALLRLVRTYPWLLEVADSNFDAAVAAARVVEAAARTLSGFVRDKVSAMAVEVIATQNQVNVNATMEIRAQWPAVASTSGEATPALVLEPSIAYAR